MGKLPPPCQPPTHLSIDSNPNNRFTIRGKVALAFSCLCGILGVAVVCWYGLAPDAAAPAWAARRVAEETGSANEGVLSSEPAGGDDAKGPVTVTAVSGDGSKKA